MSRKARLPQRPRHILVFDEDWQFIDDHFGKYSKSRMGTSSAIREIVHAWVRRLRAKHEETLNELASLEKASPDGGEA